MRNTIIDKNTYSSDTQRKPSATRATVTFVGFYHYSNCQNAMVMKPVGIPCCIYVFVSFFDCSGTNLGCVSLLNSKFPIIIRKQIFCSFAKIQKRIIDPNDPQRRWILWILSKTGYPGYIIRRVSLLRIRTEGES